MAGTQTVATIVIVNWNGEHLLTSCLDALRRQDLAGESFETWVVDNASTDGSVALIRDRFPEVRVLESPQNRGFAGGNDLALRDVRTPFAVLLNNDAVPEPSWLRELLAGFERSDGRIGAVASKTLFLPRFARFVLRTPSFKPDGPDERELGLRIHRVCVGEDDVTEDVIWDGAYGLEKVATDSYRWTRGTCELLVPFPVNDGHTTVVFDWDAERDKEVQIEWSEGVASLRVRKQFGSSVLEIPRTPPLFDVINNAGSVIKATGSGGDRGFREIDRGQFDRPEEVFAFCGNGVAIRRELLETVGLFDEDFFLYYEDSDLSWRARASGWSIYYQPTAVLRHRHASSSVEWSPMFTYFAERNRLFMLTKNASARLASRAAAGYVRASVSGAIRALMRRSESGSQLARIRVRATLSYLLALPRLIGRRRAIDRGRVVSREQLETWLLRP